MTLRVLMIQPSGRITISSSGSLCIEDIPVIGIGQETVYLDSSTRSFGICCRVEGPPGYSVTWLRDRTPITSQQQGYVFGEGYLRFSGSLTNGCAKYTCQVDFTAHSISSNETTEICVGGMSFICAIHSFF